VNAAWYASHTQSPLTAPPVPVVAAVHDAHGSTLVPAADTIVAACSFFSSSSIRDHCDGGSRTP